MCRSFYFSFILNFIFGLLAWYSRCESHQKDVPPLFQSLDTKPFPVKQHDLGAIANSDIQKKKLCIFQYDTRGRSDPITNEATRRNERICQMASSCEYYFDSTPFSFRRGTIHSDGNEVYWAKIFAFNEYLLYTVDSCSFVYYIDTDAVFTSTQNLQKSLQYLQDDKIMMYGLHWHGGLHKMAMNSGIFLVRNNDNAHSLFKYWLSFFKTTHFEQDAFNKNVKTNPEFSSSLQIIDNVIPLGFNSKNISKCNDTITKHFYGRPKSHLIDYISNCPI